MSTVIYPSPIFGPVHSRRLGISLGINLQPADGKVCSFDCIYCECGFNSDHRPALPRPTRQEVADALEQKLQSMVAEGDLPDVLTFAGNGEPTGHPDFAAIIDDTIRLRNQYCPLAKVSVLSNSTFIHRDAVREALLRVDNNILKLDTIHPDYIQRVDRPAANYDVARIISDMKRFEGHLIIQTMFMKGTFNGESVDNTTEAERRALIDAYVRIRPASVMLYSIDRRTPEQSLEKVPREDLESFAARITAATGIPVSVA